MKRVLERTHQKNSQRHQILQGIQIIHKLLSIYCYFSLHTKQCKSLWLVSDPSSHKSPTQLLHACGRAPPVCLSATCSESQPGTSPHFNCVHSIFLDVRSSDSKQFGFTHHFSISSSCQNHYNLRAANWWLIKIKVKEYLEIISVSWLSYWQFHVLLHLLGSSCRALHAPFVISETFNFVELPALSLNSWYTFPLAFQLWVRGWTLHMLT